MVVRDLLLCCPYNCCKKDGEMSEIKIRTAQVSEAELVYNFVKELAEYDRASDEFVATVDDIRNAMAGKIPYITVLIASVDGVDAGFATYYMNYTTFLGKPKMFVEDIFVNPEFRRCGAGRALFVELAKKADAEGCAKIELQVLNWNDNAVDFYESLGADFVANWLPYAIDKESFQELIK